MSLLARTLLRSGFSLGRFSMLFLRFNTVYCRGVYFGAHSSGRFYLCSITRWSCRLPHVRQVEQHWLCSSLLATCVHEFALCSRCEGGALSPSSPSRDDALYATRKLGFRPLQAYPPPPPPACVCVLCTSPATATAFESSDFFQGEIDLLKKLNHPNIVQYIDTIQTTEHLHIVLE